MAGKVLTDEDFKKSGDPTGEDTSSKGIPADKMIPADQIITEEDIPKEEPEKKETPKEEKEEVEPQPKPSDEKKYKYASLDDYDKAYKEAERKMHEATTKASTLEKELTQYRKPPEKLAPTIDDKITEITDAALNEIGNLKLEYDSEGQVLPTSANKRDRDAAIIWGKTQRKISRLEIDEVNKTAYTEREIVNKTYSAAQKEGIKTDAELRILGYEFSKTDSSIGADERINQAIESTKGILSQIREGFIKNQEQDKKEKDDLKVLGRGSTRKDIKETKETKPVTMGQQLAELSEKRRMTKDDLR